jgi:hypothetical protein
VGVGVDVDVGVGVDVDVDVDADVIVVGDVDGDGDGDVYDHSNDDTGSPRHRVPHRCQRWRDARGVSDVLICSDLFPSSY